MPNAVHRVPDPVNESVLDYAPGSPERAAIRRAVDAWLDAPPVIPCLIGGKEVETGRVRRQAIPHEHRAVAARYHAARTGDIKDSAAAALRASPTWSRVPWEERAAIFLRAADLLAGPYRARVNAATMIGQSKTPHQAEIDAACELADFWRFNCAFMQQIYEDQPLSPAGTWNRVEYRPLEGFVFAVTPFNFTSIGGNLPTAPALMGNTVVWKPASTSVASNWVVMEVLREAGLPPGVINFLPGSGARIGPAMLAQPDLAGVHFTGSTGVFHGIWKTVGSTIETYRGYPRLVGETGGKDFVFVHASAEPLEVATALVRGAFEYQGQKCSAASRAYVPRSLWPRIRREMLAQIDEIEMGDPARDFSTFMGAVIDEPSFDKIGGYIARAKRSRKAKLIAGGGSDTSRGWFIEPTVIEVEDPRHELMRDELFGPVLTVFVYPDRRLYEAIDLCDTTSPYALTGAVFARDRAAILALSAALRHAAGNFYVNDKPTGAVVGQQPFGGGRASGTNDKAGSPLNLLRWTSPRAIKETFDPPTHFAYPYMAPENAE